MKVVELFAGVGGFRLAAEKSINHYDFIWANQWEPNKKNQFAFNCYQTHFGISPNHINEDIAKVKYTIPSSFDLLVGGFPCQDYSVATTKARGIEGKKGVLWWEINDIIEHYHPRLILLENVDRLLKSPSKQRGRDFAIILSCLYKKGYDVEWMVNNGADYGFVQRRKRVFIYAYLRDDQLANKQLFKTAFKFEQSSPVKKIKIKDFKSLKTLSDKYNEGKFLNYGFMQNGIAYTYDFNVLYDGSHQYLKDILESRIDKQYWLNKQQIEKIKYLKASKRILRTKNDGTSYVYSEGKMSLFDDINKKSRTMLTSEGSINRSSHIIKSKNKYRFITPIEAERLNGFDDNWTNMMTNRQRYFCMGNALNVDLVKIMFDNLK